MSKKSKKSFAELELESYAQQQPDIHEERDLHILRVIREHLKSVQAVKKRAMEDKDDEQYARYGDIEAAFYILLEDLEKEGFAV